MAKRFIDTEIFNDDWFMELSKDAKLFYIFYITNCDHAGILKLNFKIAQIQTGIDSIETVLKELSNCLLTLKHNVYLMPSFIKYQYPNFPRSNVKQQDSALKILLSYGINEEKIKTYLTVTKELNNSYVNDNVNDNVILNKVIEEKKEILLDNLKAKFLPNKEFGIELYKNESANAQFYMEQIYRTKFSFPIHEDYVEFNSQLKLLDKVHVSLKEYAMHFRNWLATKPDRKKEDIEVDINGKPRPSKQHRLWDGKWIVE